MYGITDPLSANRIIMWVKKEPTYLGKGRYFYFDDEDYELLKNETFWVDQNGKYTFEKPYTYKYHVLIDGQWKLDHDKVNDYLIHIKNVFKSNVVTYEEMGYDKEKCNYLKNQIEKISSLDDMEEFALISIGGKYASIYSKRYNVAI